MHVPDTSGWHHCGLQVLSVKPGDFPLCSNLSRAAARSLFARKQSAYERREIIISNKTKSPNATEWHFNAKEHKAARVISLPEGMKLEQGLRALGGYSERQLVRAAELHPEPLDAGTMLMLRR